MVTKEALQLDKVNPRTLEYLKNRFREFWPDAAEVLEDRTKAAVPPILIDASNLWLGFKAGYLLRDYETSR